MKRITLITIVMLSVNFLFAFEKNNETNFMLEKTNNFILGNNNLFNSGVATIPKIIKEDQTDMAFGKDKIVISAGYGAGNFTQALFRVWTSYTDYKLTNTGPLHFKVEYGLSDKIGMGVSINYIGMAASWTYTDQSTTPPTTYNYKESFTSLSFLARLNIHFATSKILDPYWGVGVGYRSGGWSENTNAPSNVLNISTKTVEPFGFETTIGLRCYITNGIGIYIEAGFAKSVVQGGVCVAL